MIGRSRNALGTLRCRIAMMFTSDNEIANPQWAAPNTVSIGGVREAGRSGQEGVRSRWA